MRTTWQLARDAGVLWLGHLPGLITWACLGYAGNLLGQHLSTQLAANRLAATLAFIAGIMWWLGCTVLMVHSLEPGLPGLNRSANPDLLASQTRIQVLSSGLGPFVAVFSLWGLVEDQYRKLFEANLSTFGLRAELYSVNLSDWGFFLALAIGAWLAKAVLRRSGRPAVRLLQVLAEGVFVFASFAALFAIVRLLLGWLAGRQGWQWLLAARAAALGWLPDAVRTWFEQALSLVPAVVATALLPLLWVSLTGVVFGWRQFSARRLGEGTRAEPLLTRLDERRIGPVSRLALWATADLRDKYLPVAHALSLVAGRGVVFVSSVIALSAVLALGLAWAAQGIVTLIGPRTLAETVAYAPALGLLAAILGTLPVALYATAFDRGLSARPVTA